MPRTIRVEGVTNREFFEAHARPGRIGLVGGVTLVDRLIRRSQRRLTAAGDSSPWSHAFVFQGRRADGHHWVIESDLGIQHKNIRLGVQENRVLKYHDDAAYTCVAVLDLGLDEKQAQELIAHALEQVAAGIRYSMREIFGTVWALRHPGERLLENRLAQERAFYCSAFVRHVCRQINLDLAAGLAVKNTTPHDIAETPLCETRWLLVRETPERKTQALLNKVRRGLSGGPGAKK